MIISAFYSASTSTSNSAAAVSVHQAVTFRSQCRDRNDGKNWITPETHCGGVSKIHQIRFDYAESVCAERRKLKPAQARDAADNHRKAGEICP